MLASGHLEDTGRKLHVGRSRPAAIYRYRHDGEPRMEFTFPTTVEHGKPETRADDALSALMPS